MRLPGVSRNIEELPGDIINKTGFRLKYLISPEILLTDSDVLGIYHLPSGHPTHCIIHLSTKGKDAFLKLLHNYMVIIGMSTFKKYLRRLRPWSNSTIAALKN